MKDSGVEKHHSVWIQKNNTSTCIGPADCFDKQALDTNDKQRPFQIITTINCGHEQNTFLLFLTVLSHIDQFLH